MYLFLFILGSIFGSFIILVVDRIIKRESIVLPRSHCEYCGKTLKVFDLIPVLSFLFLRGRCRYCGKKLSIIYPLVEILSGLLLILAFRVSFNIYQFIFLSIAIYLALIISIIDLKTMEIFSYQVYLLLALGIIYRYNFLDFDRGFISFLIIFSLSYLLLYVLFKDALGDGDFYYYIGLSLFLKSSYLLYFLLFSIWIGAIFGLILAIKYKTTKLRMAFCPYIFLSFILILCLLNLGVILWRKKLSL